MATHKINNNKMNNDSDKFIGGLEQKEIDVFNKMLKLMLEHGIKSIELDTDKYDVKIKFEGNE